MTRPTLRPTSDDPTLAAAIGRVQEALAPVWPTATTEAECRALVFACLAVSGELVLRLLARFPTEGPAVWQAFNAILRAAFPHGNPTRAPIADDAPPTFH